MEWILLAIVSNLDTLFYILLIYMFYRAIKSFIYPDGTSRCPKCNSVIHKNAQICKSCKFNVRSVRDDKAKKFQAENLAKIKAKKEANELSPSTKPLKPNSSDDKQEEIVKPSKEKKYSIDGITFKTKSDYDNYKKNKSNTSK